MDESLRKIFEEREFPTQDHVEAVVYRMSRYPHNAWDFDWAVDQAIAFEETNNDATYERRGPVTPWDVKLYIQEQDVEFVFNARQIAEERAKRNFNVPVVLFG